MSAPSDVSFGPFRLDLDRRVLWKGAALVGLAPKAADLLTALVRRRGQLATKEELLHEVWPDTFVEEANLSVLVSQLRRELGGGKSDFIETVPRRGYRFVAAPPAEPQVVSNRTSVAVLPFREGTSFGAEDPLGFGLAEAVIAHLARSAALSVRPSSAVFPYAGKAVSAAAVAADLRVDRVVEGRYRRDGERMAVTVEVVRAEDGSVAGLETVEAAASDLFGLKNRVAGRVAAVLGLPTLSDAGRKPARPEAYEAALRGSYFWNKLTGPSLAKARAAYESALAFDPDLALAHAGLANTSMMEALFGFGEPRRALDLARDASFRAVAKDEQSFEPRLSRAFSRLFSAWDFEGAEDDLARAVELAPDRADPHQWRALYLALTGRFEEAFVELQRALEIDPLSLTVRTGMGFHVYLTQQHSPDTDAYERTLELDPEFAIGYWALGLAHDASERFDDAAAAYTKAVELSGGSALIRSNLARSLALGGRTDEARALLGSLREAAISPFRLATVELALGEPAAALASLALAVDTKDHWAVWLKVDPMLGPLRDDPAFAALVSRVPFP